MLGASLVLTLLGVTSIGSSVSSSRASYRAPQYSDDPAEDIPNCYPLDGSPQVEFFVNVKGLKIACYEWSVPKPKAVVLLVHGVQSHARFQYLRHVPSENNALTEGEEHHEGENPLHPACLGKKIRGWCIYEGSWVEELNKAGVSVHGMDLQGFGLSEGWQGLRSNVERLDDLAVDVTTKLTLLAEHVRRQQDEENAASGEFSAPPPLYAVGFSLGGFAVLRGAELLAEQNHWLVRPDGTGDGEAVRLEGLAGLAPMLSLDRMKSIPVNRLALSIGHFLSWAAPHFPVSKTTPNRKPSWFDKHKMEDPFIPYGMRIPARMCMEMVLAVPRVLEKASVLPRHLRLLLIHSKKDRICEFKGSQRFFSLASHLQDRLFVQLEKGSHFLTTDEGNGRLGRLLARWIVSRPKRSKPAVVKVREKLTQIIRSESPEEDGDTKLEA